MNLNDEKTLSEIVEREFVRQHRCPAVDALTDRVGPAMVALMFNVNRGRFEEIVAAMCAREIARN
jgi:hypothetical protein